MIFLLVPLVLTIAAAVFQHWAYTRSPWGPSLTFGGAGVIMLGVAFLTYNYALYGACHGEYNFLKNSAGCTRPLDDPLDPKPVHIVKDEPLPSRTPSFWWGAWPRR